MITITADGSTLAALQQASGPAEVHDPEGKVVGFFTPAVGENGFVRTEEEWEELRRRAQSTGGHTLKEIFQRMQSLTADESMRARLQEYIDRMAEDEAMDKRIDWAEIERRKKEEAGKGRRLFEIFEHLKTLTQDPEEQADLQRHIDRLRAEDGCVTP